MKNTPTFYYLENNLSFYSIADFLVRFKSLSEHKQANKMFCVSFVLRMKMKSHSILHSLVTDVLCHDF